MFWNNVSFIGRTILIFHCFEIQKLAVGGLPEKILTALQLVHDEAVNEEEALGKFQKAISSVQEIEKDVLYATSQGLTQDVFLGIYFLVWMTISWLEFYI